MPASTCFDRLPDHLLPPACSVGIHAAIMAVAGPGDTLLAPRSCHQSVLAGMVLAGGWGG
jgi:arginine/lysine/ornithine decarboxylase